MSTGVECPKISPVYCPIKPKIADSVEELQLYADGWANGHNFFPNDKALKRFHSAKFAWLGARAYADARPEMLELITGWLCFTFFLDDQCEKQIGSDPEQLRQFFARFVSYLNRPADAVCEGKGPLFDSLDDLWKRTLPNAPTPTWSKRFIQSLSDYFESNAWEAGNKQSNRIPSLDEYIHNRQFTVGAYLFFDLEEVTQSIQLPETFSSELKRLSTMANNIIAWFNDIVSLEKELPTGDCHNLVLVLQHEMKCTLQTAMDRAVEMHNLEMKSFLELEHHILHHDDSHRDDSNVVSYINGLRNWIQGNVYWSYESGRYLPDGAAPEDLVISYFK